ncbi:hypothetical protein FACS189454_04480 [Planctomycetales bacterium]|nr:hypothetical protein FACS189454_04480 [Planctomycetales bacterium]
MVCGLVQPIFAAADDGERQPDWVLPYFLIAVFLGLSLTILLRPSKRRNTAFTDAELNAQKEQAMKEMKGYK